MQTLKLIPQRFTRIFDFVLGKYYTNLCLGIHLSGYCRRSASIAWLTCCLLIGTLFASVASAALNLNGAALHSELGKDQFIAGLYVEDLSKDSKQILLSNQRKRMEIKVLARRLLSRKFQRQWIEGVAINAGNNDLTKHAQNLADFSNMLKIKLIKDDTLTIERTFRRGVIISINGVTLGIIKDTRFFDLLLRSWIGPVPLSSNFKEALLQAGSIEPVTLARFNSVRTTNERVQKLTEVLASKENNQSNADNKPPAVKVSTTTTSVTAASITTAPKTTLPTSAIITNTAAITGAVLGTIEQNDTQTNELPVSDQVVTEQLQDETLDSDALDSEAYDEELTDFNTEDTDIATDDSNQIIGNDIFDDEDDDDFSYTAANLLSRQLYISKLTQWTRKTTKYPKSALRKSEQGTVRMAIVINRKGKVINQKITDTSGVKSLDKAAQKAIKKASPYPAIPEIIAGDSFVFTVPIVFALRPK